MRLLFCIIKPTHPYFFNHVILTFFTPPNRNQGKNLKAESHQSTISKEGERYHLSSHHYSRCHSHFGFFSSSLLFEARVFQRLVEVLLFSKSCLSLCDPRDCSPPPPPTAQLLCPWDFWGKNTGMGYYFLLQGIFLTQGWNQSLLRWQVDSWPLSRQESPCSMTFKLYLLKRHFPRSPGNLIPCSTFLWPQVDCSPHVCISFFSITFLFSIVFSFFLGGVINFDPFVTSQLQVTSHQLTYSTAVVLVPVKCLFLLTCFLFNKTSRMGKKKVFFKHEILKLLT